MDFEGHKRWYLMNQESGAQERLATGTASPWRIGASHSSGGTEPSGPAGMAPNADAGIATVCAATMRGSGGRNPAGSARQPCAREGSGLGESREEEI